MNLRSVGARSAFVLLTMLASRPVSAEVDVHIGIGVPPPPDIVFESAPRAVIVPRSDVYYVPDMPDYDMYRYGRWWYINRDGYWFRARDYRGPFGPIEYHRVPRRIIGLPTKYHRNPMRPHRHRAEGHHRGGHHDGRHDRGRHDGRGGHDRHEGGGRHDHGEHRR